MDFAATLEITMLHVYYACINHTKDFTVFVTKINGRYSKDAGSVLSVSPCVDPVLIPTHTISRTTNSLDTITNRPDILIVE